MNKLRECFIAMKALKTKGNIFEQVFKEYLDKDNFLQSPIPNIKTNDVAYMLIDWNELSTAYTDLTGRFPVRSSCGNQYVIIGYHYVVNYIHGIAIKDREAATLTAV